MRAPAVAREKYAGELLSRIRELSTRMDELAELAAGAETDRSYPHLLRATADRMNRRLAAARGGSVTPAELCDLLADVSAMQFMLREHTLGPSGLGPARIAEGLGRLRRKTAAEDVLDAAPAEACAALGFDRAMISGVRGSIWAPRLLFRSGGGADGSDRELADFLAGLEIPLASPMIEAEVVRRRLPALIIDAPREPRTFRPLIELSRTREYVVAPIVSSGAVLGLLHVDNHLSRRPLTTADRDAVRAFADGVGVIHERVVLESRLARRREHLGEVFRAAEQILGDPAEPSIGIPGPAVRAAFAMPADGSGTRSAPRLEPGGFAVGAREPEGLAALTVREREVLELLASGATNAQVADRLTVAESTVKSHVKHILHKLGAPNRAGAIARYLRAGHNDRRI